MRLALAVMLIVLTLGHGEVRAEVPASNGTIPNLSGLKTQVAFWKQVFTRYSTHEAVIHDTWHLDRIYSVLDFRSQANSFANESELSTYIDGRVKEEKERVRAVLLRLQELDGSSDELTPEEQQIRALFGNDADPIKFQRAAALDRIRTQRGLRERFMAGIEVSRRYLPEMEAIFRRAGLPQELTRLPLVESCFNVRAYSKAGAAGVWQFMPSTGRLYMRIDARVDERRDPIESTHAAAALLQRNYEVLGTWPLAITAYNHGRAGIARAVDAVNTTDLVKIIEQYDGPLFKFASRNFYAEFLAALDVERNAATYFGDLRPHAPQHGEQVSVPDPVTIGIAAQAARTDIDTLADLNPALTPDVVKGKLLIPKGWRLRVPLGSATDFRVRYASILPRLKPAKDHGTRYVTHRVQRGQTLAAIARQYGTSTTAIQRRNRLRGASVRAGQSLIIPTVAPATS